MRKFLLYSSALVLLSGVAEAACIQTPTCSSLGYSSTSSCEGGTKCPFGEAWNCTASETKTELTEKITELTNKITEQTNKITNLETQITEIKKEVATSNCLVGDILYSDMSCNTNVVASKKPIGVIFDITNRLAIGLEEKTELHWSTESFDVPELSNITSSSAAAGDWQGKKNTQIILEYCKAKGKSCPAFEYANSYKTEGTSAGDWYLPALGELKAIYNNKDVLNTALDKIGGTKWGINIYGRYWSSSEYTENYAWVYYPTDSTVEYKNKWYNEADVRPVLAF